GRRRSITSESAHAASDAITIASRLLIDCPGMRTIGAVASNGASAASTNAPAAATLRVMGSRGEFQDPCHAIACVRARHDGCIGSPHMRSAGVSNQAARPAIAGGLTVGESSFRNAKFGRAALVAYKAAADVAAKGSFFLLTILAARRLTPAAFGLFSLGPTIGWMLSVTADFGVQMHVARRTARAPHLAQAMFSRWWRVRIVALLLSIAALAAGLAAVGASFATSVTLVLFSLVYAT